VTDFSFVPYREHSHSLLHRQVLDAIGSNGRGLLLESNTHTEAVWAKTKDFKTLQQMVRQIIARHQKASVVCEIKFIIFITALDCIPKMGLCCCNKWRTGMVWVHLRWLLWSIAFQHVTALILYMTEIPLSNLCQQTEHPKCISFSEIIQIESSL